MLGSKKDMAILGKQRGSGMSTCAYRHMSITIYIYIYMTYLWQQRMAKPTWRYELLGEWVNGHTEPGLLGDCSDIKNEFCLSQREQLSGKKLTQIIMC